MPPREARRYASRDADKLRAYYGVRHLQPRSRTIKIWRQARWENRLRQLFRLSYERDGICFCGCRAARLPAEEMPDFVPWYDSLSRQYKCYRACCFFLLDIDTRAISIRAASRRAYRSIIYLERLSIQCPRAGRQRAHFISARHRRLRRRAVPQCHARLYSAATSMILPGDTTTTETPFIVPRRARRRAQKYSPTLHATRDDVANIRAMPRSHII